MESVTYSVLWTKRLSHITIVQQQNRIKEYKNSWLRFLWLILLGTVSTYSGALIKVVKSSLWLLSDPLWPGVVLPNGVPFISKIGQFENNSF